MSRVTERWRPRIGRGVLPEIEVAVRTSAACWTVQASMRSSMGAMGRGVACGFAVVVVASMIAAVMRGAVGGGVDGV